MRVGSMVVLLLAMGGSVGCSEYGLEIGPPGNELGTFDPSDKTGGDLPGLADADLEFPGAELGIDDTTPGDDPDIPLFVDGSTEPSDDPTEDPDEPEIPGDDDPEIPGDDDPGEDTIPTDDPEDPPDHIPDETPSTECDPLDIAVFDSVEIWVGNNGTAPTVASGTLIAPAAGWYDLSNIPIMESGASQHNESAYFRIQNATNPGGHPAFGNCGDEWIVADDDNSGTPTGLRTYLGTFWLDAGPNTLVMEHYCELFSLGQCLQFHNDQPVDQTCDSGNINSVHFLGDAVCLEHVDGQ